MKKRGTKQYTVYVSNCRGKGYLIIYLIITHTRTHTLTHMCLEKFVYA